MICRISLEEAAVVDQVRHCWQIGVGSFVHVAERAAEKVALALSQSMAINYKTLKNHSWKPREI